LDWHRVRDLAEGLLQWMDRGSFPPETAPVSKAADDPSNESPRTLGSEWNRTVAQAACRYALDLANQVLKDPNGIPHGVPFTRSCCNCDVDGSIDHDKAVDDGWFRIRFVPQSPGENLIGLCPSCESCVEEFGQRELFGLSSIVCFLLKRKMSHGKTEWFPPQRLRFMKCDSDALKLPSGKTRPKTESGTMFCSDSRSNAG